MQENLVVRTQDDLETDKKMLRSLIGLAADVELFTIPLYMSALYSIAGTEAKSDGSVFPYMGPSESYSLQGKASQKAYNIIYSVYIQEMLHLQLALNIGNILGVEKANLQALSYPMKAEDPNWIPCLGKLGDLNPKLYPEFKYIKSTLGPLDRNAINLFLAIELPDEDSLVPTPPIPLTCAPEDVINTTFGGIGKLYTIIMNYMDFTYPDGNSLFEHCYADATSKANGNSNDIVQVNLFKNSPNSKSAYSHMTLELSENASATVASLDVKEMINAIISEGEGSNRSNNNFVSPNYCPDKDDIPADALWGAFSHWARFEAVKEIFEEVETWPKWRAKRLENGPAVWRWQDLVADELAVTPAQKSLAEQRAAAWNDPSTEAQLNTILNSTFTQFLKTLNNYWNQASHGVFPFGAMQAISSRVSSVWAAGGVPEFAKTKSSSQTDLHSCQGLNDADPEKGIAKGSCDCATAVQHACVTTNSCANQGGCGYPYNQTKGSDLNFIPRENSCQGKGGCGSPIPLAQTFSDPSGLASPPVNGKNVWEHAWNTFNNKPLDNKDFPAPSNIRVILPPS